MEQLIIKNKVAESGLVVLDPADWLRPYQPVGFDLKDFLYMGMVLREKAFREELKGYDWTSYTGKLVALYCSADAIVPMWAYMLVNAYLQQKSAEVYFGTPEAVRLQRALAAVERADFSEYAEGRLILKGCGDESIPAALYVGLTNKLVPLVKSLMYGEPCSTVPVFKK
jgi:hypothetical protein